MGTVLNLTLGLALIFAAFALFASGISEVVATIFNLRGRTLYNALAKTIGAAATKKLFDSPAAAPFQRTRKFAKSPEMTSPSYLPNWLFATTMVQGDVHELAQGADEPTPAELATQLTAHLPADGATQPVTDLVKGLVTEAGDDLDAVRKKLEHWYDAYMDRVSGWYKRYSRRILFAVGLVIAVLANVDAVGLTRTLVSNEPLRTQLAADSASTEASGCKPDDLPCINKALESLPAGQLGLFWTSTCAGDACGKGFWSDHGVNGAFDWLEKVAGILLGAFAISLGAPFWFDIIGRGNTLKNTGPTPASTAS